MVHVWKWWWPVVSQEALQQAESMRAAYLHRFFQNFQSLKLCTGEGRHGGARVEVVVAGDFPGSSARSFRHHPAGWQHCHSSRRRLVASRCWQAAGSFAASPGGSRQHAAASVRAGQRCAEPSPPFCTAGEQNLLAACLLLPPLWSVRGEAARCVHCDASAVQYLLSAGASSSCTCPRGARCSMQRHACNSFSCKGTLCWQLEGQCLPAGRAARKKTAGSWAQLSRRRWAGQGVQVRHLPLPQTLASSPLACTRHCLPCLPKA